MRVIDSAADIIDDVTNTNGRGWLGRDFAFDVETSGLNPRSDLLLGVALRFSDGESVYLTLKHTIPDADGRFPLVSLIEELELRNLIRPLFLQRDVVMVGHNLKFDLHFLDRVGIDVRGRLFDTMLAAQIIDENRDSLSLKDLAPLELGMHLDHYQSLVEYPGFPKDSILAVPLAKAAKYAIDDVEATWRLYEKYQVELVEEGVEDPFLNIWMPLTYTLFEMERRGIPLDIELVKQVRAEYVTEAATHEWAIWQDGVRMILERYGDQIPTNYLVPLKEKFPEIDGQNLEIEAVEHMGVILPIFRKISKNGKIIGHPKIPWFNPNSGDQLRELIYDFHKLQLPSTVRIRPTESGKIAINADAIKVMRHALGDEAPPVLDHILKLRKATKFVGTYLDRFIEDADPSDWYAIHTWFNQHITDTGRLSSSSPNLQNIPSRGPEGKQARKMFIARPGHVLVVADYSQMELRMLAHYSQDPVLLKAFADDLDLHIITGARQGGMSYEELFALVEAEDPEGKKLRSIGKTSNFALTYGMASKKYQLRLAVDNGLWVPLDTAGQWIADYDATYQGATDWKRRVEKYAHMLGYVKTIGGRKRRLPELYSSDRFDVLHAQRQAVNAVIQGSCADIISYVIPFIQAALLPMGGQMLLQVHDEIVCEVPVEFAKAAANVVSVLMADLANEKFKLRCPMVADAHVGASWGDAKG